MPSFSHNTDPILFVKEINNIQLLHNLNNDIMNNLIKQQFTKSITNFYLNVSKEINITKLFEVKLFLICFFKKPINVNVQLKDLINHLKIG